MPKPLTSWSYSRWDMWHTCPLKFKLAVIEGNKEPENAGMARGKAMHDVIGKWLQPVGDELAGPPPKEAGKAIPVLLEVAQFENRVVEQQWGYTSAWKPTGWFGKDTWFRSVLDVGVLYDDLTAEVIDWKSGKPRGTHEDQMELFAMSVMIRVPSVTHVSTRLVYTDFEHQEFGEYPAGDLEKLKAKWERAVRPMFEDEVHLPRPGEACRYCHFSRSNGGVCRYG